MANLKSAIKKIRVTARNRARNVEYKTKMRKLINEARAKKTPDAIRKAQSIIDKLSLKGIIHQNRAGHLKSTLFKLSAKA
ncbi:MAG: 30S ribosomal protein S20 [Candidatus Margulisiibacteriota bacterium]